MLDMLLLIIDKIILVDYPSLFKDYNQTQQTSHIDQSDTKPQEYINNDDDDEGGWLDDFMTKINN